MLSAIFFLLFLGSAIVLIVGLVKPEKAIKWGAKRTRKQVVLIYGSMTLVFMILSTSTVGHKKESTVVGQNQPQQQVEEPAVNQPVKKTEEKPATPVKTEVNPPKQNEPMVNEEVPVAKTWQQVASWQGDATKKTEPFTITSNQWRVTWKTTGDPEYGALSIFIFHPGESVMTDSVVWSAKSNTSDTSYFYTPGIYYLDINAANLSWNITVEEYK